MARRLLVLSVALVVIAAACGDDTTSDSVAAEGETDAAVGDAAGSSTDDDAAVTTPDVTEPPAASTVVPREELDGGGQLLSSVAEATQVWETDWTRSTIELSELALGLRGFDPRDGIPPIYRPTFESVGDAAEWIEENEPGVLVEVGGDARFYPLSILTRHEIVNDDFGNQPVAVTYCPLCNTAVAYSRVVDGQTTRFGVSGLLRKSDLVMWDHTTTSLWQQITGEGIVGTYAGVDLEVVPASIVAFGQFAERFPEGTSLSPDTGVGRGYGSNPYVGYSSQDGPFRAFFPDEVDDRLPALERVVGVEVDGTSVAYPFSTLQAEGVVNDTIGDTPVTVLWGGDTTDALDEASIAESRAIGTAVAYSPVVDDVVLTLSANGDGTFVDDQTGSTWTVLGLATGGELEGTQLEVLRHRNEFWFAFAGFFPEATLYG